VTTEPEILMALVDPDEKAFVWRSLRIQVSLVNGSLPSGIGVRSLTLSVPSAMALEVIGRKARADGAVELVPTALDLRTPGERRDFAPVELTPKRIGDLRAQLFSVLTYRPRREVFVATLAYEGLADRKQGTKTSRLVVSATAHPLGMYAGAVLGSLLAALFLVLFRWARPPAAPAAGGAPAAPLPAPPTHRERARDFLLRFVRGVVATGIAILILQTTAEVALPINITVHDFYGGVLLGLFGDKVGDAIFKRIFEAA
jgi:hypothetical protein